ncbi:MAG: SusC/RagA family TonB-linked outer membrane protein [Bacteroidetes bacterium]|nr:SusC/RagA family TonB-linked outer membrane protein [Bacteroidota bacterium]
MNKTTTLFFSIILFISGFFSSGNLFAQKQNVSGLITDKVDGSTIVGIVIRVKNTSQGTISDINGRYSIIAPKQTDTLVFSFIGYNEMIIPINGRTKINVEMVHSTIELNSVVVTALGIKREEKSLGYSVSEVKGDQLQTAKDVSIANQLSGKVAGLDVSASNGGAAASSKIVLRGNKSFTSNNQALIVVDGVPIDNSTISNAGDKWGGRDYGSGISDVNSDDIESITVLKGASAAALYGSRASNGVILITTKKGKVGKKIQIDFNSNTSIDMPVILWKLQNTYGAGRNGKFEGPWNTSSGTPVYDATNASAYGSWGPKMEGQKIIDWDGKEKSYSPQPNNYSDYFSTGLTMNNSLSLSGGKKATTYRFTLTDLRNKDIVPNVEMNRTNLSLNVGTKIMKRVALSMFGSYVKQNYNNRLGLSDAHNNVNRNYIMMPRNISNQSLQDNVMNANGEEQTWYRNWNWMTNPYWDNQFELNDDSKDRFFGNISLLFDLDTNLTLIIRGAPDYSIHNFTNQDAYGGLIGSLGSYSEREIKRNQINTDILISYKKDWQNISISANAGGNLLYDRTNEISANTQGGLAIPNEYSIENSLNTPIRKSLLFEKEIISAYFSGQIAYKNYLYLDLTARNDWSSTLPPANNSYFYPSISSSFVFSEFLHLSKKVEKIFSFGKLRASWASVGNDTDPYRLNKTYYVDTTDNYGTIAYVTGIIPPSNLKPEKLVSMELGTDLRFLNNRLGIDFTYYKTNSYNQIVRIDVSPSSGSRYALINAGNIENKGIELQLTGKPIEKKNFSWSFILNYAKNKSEVIELAEGVDNLQLMEHWGLSIEARPGHPYGDIVGYAIKRDENGNKLVDENGLYIRTESAQVLGNINPKFKLSLSNSISWKKISLSFLVDAKIGGQIFAGTNMYGYGYAGNFEETLEGREEWYASEAAREAAGVNPADWIATGGYLAEGVLANGSTNNIYVNPEKYWSQFSNWTNEIHDPFVYDASYVKLREVTLTWELPSKWLSPVKIKKFYLSIYGRNLWLLYSQVPNIDPEAFHDSENGMGYELYSYPGRRNIGFNLKFNF